MARVAAGPEIERLIQLLARLPGLGPRSARRAALHLVKKKEQLLEPLAAALAETRDTILTCEICGNIDTQSPCTLVPRSGARPLADLRGGGGRRSLGAGARRRAQRPLSRARRHAVAARRHRPRRSRHRQADRARARSRRQGGAAGAQRHGRGPVHRALSDGPARRTANVTVSRLAHGVPIGGELDYLDEGTLAAAVKARKTM